ncbi:MAG: hypothetical protein NZ928_00720 [Endomicrobia bacterium]|nr:hypothetical protein [Endomicrobiia bacterium]MDW8056210.1 hypothetical protein [Elusimicrobiota bacterium]
MKRKLLINILVTISIFNLCFCIEYKELISKLEQQDEKITKLKAEYYQIINFVDLKEVYELKAKFVYRKPDKLKIYIEEPFKQIVLADSNKVLVNDIVNNTIYKFDTAKYFEKNYNYLPLIFSQKGKNKKYTISDFIKKTGLKFVKEEEKYYVLSTRYAKGKTYNDKKVGLRPGETRFILWINKTTLFPEKVNMISEKYVVETEFRNFETEFNDDEMFDIIQSSNTKVIVVE